MATLYITEYTEVTVIPPGWVTQAPLEPPIAEQTVTIQSPLQNSLAFNPATILIRVHADSICSIAVGPAPVATTNTGRMAANQTEYRGVRPGRGYFLSVIANV